MADLLGGIEAWLRRLRAQAEALNGDVAIRLEDTGGANKLRVRNALDSDVFTLDSLGVVGGALNTRISTAESTLSDLYARFVNLRASPSIHFTTGSAPAGWSWASGVFNGTPAGLSYSSQNHYLNTSPLDSNRYFFYQSPGGIRGTQFYARVGCGHNGAVGWRIDDGSDNNYYEGFYRNSAAGTQQFRMRQRAGGGAVTTTDGATAMLGSFYGLMAWAYPNNVSDHIPYFYVFGENGATYILGYGVNCTWTASRVGIVVNQDAGGGPAGVDWIL